MATPTRIPDQAATSAALAPERDRGARPASEACPGCGGALEGLATFCHGCGEYVADIREGRAETVTTVTPANEARANWHTDDRLESEIQHAITQALELFGFAVYDLGQDRPTRQTAGLGDLYVVGHGRCTWIEVKRPRGTQSDAQLTFEARVRANGGEYLVLRHEDEAVGWAERARRSAA